MLTVILGTGVYILLSAFVKAEEAETKRCWEESESTDWNEYYANTH